MKTSILCILIVLERFRTPPPPKNKKKIKKKLYKEYVYVLVKIFNVYMLVNN